MAITPGRGVIVVVALVGAMLLAPLHAAAATPVTGVETVGVGSQRDLQSLKWASAECPKGKVVIGGGAAIDGAEGEVFIRSMVPGQHPVTGRHRYLVTARDAGSVSEPWRVLAFATCADPITGLQLRVHTGPNQSDQHEWAAIQCLEDEKLIGMGGSVTGGPKRVFLSAMFQAGWETGRTPAATWVGGQEHPDGYDERWSVTAYAICAPDTINTISVYDSVWPHAGGASGPAQPACADLESNVPMVATSAGMSYSPDYETGLAAYTQIMPRGGNPATSARVAAASPLVPAPPLSDLLNGYLICAETTLGRRALTAGSPHWSRDLGADDVSEQPPT